MWPMCHGAVKIHYKGLTLSQSQSRSLHMDAVCISIWKHWATVTLENLSWLFYGTYQS